MKKPAPVRKRTHRKPNRIALSPAQLVAIRGGARAESSSVELTRNAKGDTQIKVSVAAAEGEAIAATAARAEACYDALARKYTAPKTGA